MDLAVLDIMLPGLDGITVLRAMRREGPNAATPVLMLTARREESDKVLGLDSGADDYLTKPFGMDELLARLRAALRHQLQVQGERPGFRTGDLSVDLVRRIVSRQRPDTTRPTIAELRAGSDAIFLFERPVQRVRNALDEDGIAHHALTVTREEFDKALVELKALGLFRSGPIEYPSGLGLYFFDPDGNHLQLEVPGEGL